MPILEKDIVPVGRFLVSTPTGRRWQEFTPEYIERIAKGNNAMLDAGLRIPAPFDHNKAAVPIQINEASSSTFNNAGYWVRFGIGKNSKGKLGLKGFVDVPGSDNEPDSPYYKAKHTAKEVSLNLRDLFQDGLGRVWPDALMHVALVHHAIVPDQDEFKELASEGSIINMSMEDGNTDDSTLISTLIAALKENLEITLPSTSDVKQFLRDLHTAILNAPARMPGHQTIEPVPIYMSGDDMALSKEQAEGIVASKAINPTTKLPFTMEDLGFKKQEDVQMSALAAENVTLKQQVSQAAAALKAVMSKFANDTRKTLTDRIQRLVDKGTIDKEYADKHLFPNIEFSMSITDKGDFSTHPLEMSLSALEAVKVPTQAQTQADPFTFDGTIEIPALAGGTEAAMTDAELEAAIERTIKLANQF